jgi:hypothetical protein
VCLPLTDRFDYKCPKLVSKLTGKLAPYLGLPATNNNHSASPEKPQMGTLPANSAVPANQDTASALSNVFGLFNSMISGAKALTAKPSA